MRSFLTALLLIAAFVSGAAEALPLDEFLNRTRNPQPFSSYAMLEGEVQHRRRGEDPQSAPLYFGIILQPERMTGQIVIDGSEGYLLGQTRKGGTASQSAVPQGKSAENRLGRMGIRPSDLTMSFLYYPVEKELPAETVRTVPCRVVELVEPNGGERVRVYIARDYFFPLKAEFFLPDNPDAPYRTLEVSSFKKSNDLYYTDELGLYGPGWRTRIRFDKAEVAPYDPAHPPAVIRPLPAASK